MSNHRPGPGRPKGADKENGFKMKKMSKVEVEHFIRESTKLIFNQHFSFTEYIEWCRDKGLSREQSIVYWKRVWENVKERFRLEKDKLVDKHLQSYWTIHAEAMNSGDLSNARQTLDAIAKLQGLNEPDKIDIKGTTTIEFKFGDEE
jgi:hypothetical protein